MVYSTSKYYVTKNEDSICLKSLDIAKNNFQMVATLSTFYARGSPSSITYFGPKQVRQIDPFVKSIHLQL
jgi:hypothetical protein